MKKIFFKVSVLLLALAICPVVNSQKKSAKKSVDAGLTLAYKYSAEKEVKYMNKTNIVQTMDINGQSMEVNVASFLSASVKSKGIQNSNLSLEIKIDSMAQSVDSPQGSSGGPVADVKGKVFTMVITPGGKEIDLSDAKKVVISSDGGGKSDASQSFMSFFPDLPAVAVTPGYTWSTTDTIKSMTADNSMESVVKADNKFEGFEIVNGVNCAKISSVLAGTRIQKTQTQGMDLTINGTFTGTSVLYFLPEEGYFIKQTVISKLTGTIDITTPDTMSFPIIMDMTSVNEVIK